MLIKDFITKVDEDAFINIVPTISAWGKEDGLQNLKESKALNTKLKIRESCLRNSGSFFYYESKILFG